MLDERPSAAELIAAVADFLQSKVAPHLDAHTSFHMKVAVNALRIVEREVRAGENVAEVERVRALCGEAGGALPPGDLHALNQELCRRIADGRLSPDDPALARHLVASALYRLAIDNPSYPALAAARKHWPELFS